MEILHTISSWFLLFITYSCAGWLMEMIITVFTHRRFYNRGFLIGPLCPIYGVGGTLVTLILGQQENILEIFCVVVLLGGLIEYVTSYIMEKLFHARWWDYSGQPFNLNGRICLPALIGFGVLGVCAVKIASPFLFHIFSLFSDTTIICFAVAILVVLISDLIISMNLAIHFRATAKDVHGDATEEITEYIRSVFAQNGRALNLRLLHAFPTMEIKPEAKSVKRSRKGTKKQKSRQSSK